MENWYFGDNKIDTTWQASELPKEGFVWLDAAQEQVLSVVEVIQQLTQTPIIEQHIKDCQNLQHPCFYDSSHAYDLLVFRTLLSDGSRACVETMPVFFIIFSNLLVTFSTDHKAIERVKKRLETTRKKLPEDPCSLLFIILDEIIDNFLDLKVPLINKSNDWQQILFNENIGTVDWMDFLNFKSSVRKLRVLSEDQQDVIYQWRQDNDMAMGELLTIRYNDLFDHIRRIMRASTQLESDLDTLIQIHYSLIGNRTTNVMRVLTVLSAIFLPLNLIAGIFGMNFNHMPLFEAIHGPALVLGSMAMLSLLLYAVFKWKEWI